MYYGFSISMMELVISTIYMCVGLFIFRNVQSLIYIDCTLHLLSDMHQKDTTYIVLARCTIYHVLYLAPASSHLL